MARLTESVAGQQADQRVWMAIQPALQATGRVLEVHPTFQALANWLNRRLVPEHLLAEPYIKDTTKPAQKPGTQPAQQPGTQPAQQPGTQPGTQPAQQPGAQPTPQPGTQPGTQQATGPPPGKRKRRRNGVEWMRYIYLDDEHWGAGRIPDMDNQATLAEFLKETKGTYNAGQESEKAMKNIEYEIGIGLSEIKERGAFLVPWGFTTVNGWNKTDQYPLVAIAAIGVWPLLVPTFTKAEKGVCAKHVASTILHEIAVGFAFFARIGYESTLPPSKDPDLWLTKAGEACGQQRSENSRRGW